MFNESKNPLEQFVTYSIGTLVIICVAVVGLYSWRIINYDDVGNLGSLLQGTIGVVVALAGSIVAINLANQAYIVSKQTEQREFIEKTIENIENALVPFLTASKELRICFEIENLFLIKWEPQIRKMVKEIKEKSNDFNEDFDIFLNALVADVTKNPNSESNEEIYNVLKKIDKLNMHTYFALRNNLYEHMNKFIDAIDAITTNSMSLLIWHCAYQKIDQENSEFKFEPSIFAGRLREGLFTTYLDRSDSSYPEVIFRPFSVKLKFEDYGFSTLMALGSEFFDLDINNLNPIEGLDDLVIFLRYFPLSNDGSSDEFLDNILKDILRNRGDNTQNDLNLICNDPRIQAIKRIRKKDLFGDQLLSELEQYLNWEKKWS